MKSFLVLAVAFLAVVVVYGEVQDPTIPVPRTDTPGWVHMHDQQMNMTRDHGPQVKVIFLGDSITEGWNWKGANFTQDALWKEHYASRGAFNYGIGGSRTEHLLWRLNEGIFKGLTPKLLVLMIGTNNIAHGNRPQPIVKAIHLILESIRAKLPQTKILLLSILPRPVNAQHHDEDPYVVEINTSIAKFADASHITWLDLGVHFENGPSHQIESYFNANDKIHLTSAGYAEWYKWMEPTFAKLIA